MGCYLYWLQEMDPQSLKQVPSPTECGLTILEVPESSTNASPSIAASKEVNSAMPHGARGDLNLFNCSVGSDLPTSEGDITGASV